MIEPLLGALLALVLGVLVRVRHPRPLPPRQSCRRCGFEASPVLSEDEERDWVVPWHGHPLADPEDCPTRGCEGSLLPGFEVAP